MKAKNLIMGDYEKEQKEMGDALNAVATTSKSKVAKAAARTTDNATEKVCRIVRMLVDEALDMYESGTMEYMDMVNDLTDALKSVDTKSSTKSD